VCREGRDEGVDVGVGVVVEGESSVRGMELMTRSEAKGRCFINLGDGGVELFEAGDAGKVGGGGGAFMPASSHASRADGSTGQAGGEISFGGGGLLLEEAFPMMSCMMTIV